MATLDDFIETFAASIWAKACFVRRPDVVGLLRRRTLESISDDIKKCSDLAVPRVSRAAREEAAKRKLDLGALGWHDQPAFDPSRAVFHREHVTPVAAIRDRCLSASCQSDIAGALKSVQVAWILKAEDRKLTELGFRSVRPDPEEAYRLAGISLE